MFEHTEGDMEELSHDGADDAHFWFASGAKSGSEVTQGCVVFDGDQSRHVEGLTQVAVALFTQASVAAHRGAAFCTSWSQAGMSGSLAGALHLTGSRHLGQKDGGGERADSFDRAEQLMIAGELLVRSDLLTNELFQAGLLRAECSDDAL